MILISLLSPHFARRISASARHAGILLTSTSTVMRADDDARVKIESGPAIVVEIFARRIVMCR